MEKRKLSSNEINSKAKKAKNNKDDVAAVLIENNLEIKDLTEHVLIDIIKMIPIMQWASLERVSHQFRQAVSRAWWSVKEIQFDENFIYNFNGYNSVAVLNIMLKKLIKRAPNITAIGGFSIFTKRFDWVGSIGNNAINLLAQFKCLKSVSFADSRLLASKLALFLKTSKSRGRLKELNLSMDPEWYSHDLLHTAFSEIPDFPSLKLNKIIFHLHATMSDYSLTFGFLEFINTSELTTLKFSVTGKNLQNFILLLNHCIHLLYLDINFANCMCDDKGRQLAFDLLQAIVASPIENLTTLKLRATCNSFKTESNLNPEWTKLISEVGQRYRLQEFALLGCYFCNTDVVLAVLNKFLHLTSLEVCSRRLSHCDSATWMHLLTRLTKLEKLMFGSLYNREINGNVVEAIAANLINLKSLSLYGLAREKSMMFNCLSSLDKLEELSISQGVMSIKTLTAWKGFGRRLKILELHSCNVVCDKGLINLIKYLPHLRRLDLYGCKITDIGLKAIVSFCPLLSDLDLSFCLKITLVGIQAVVDGCPMIKRLVLRRSKKLNIVLHKELKLGKYRMIKFD